MSRDLVTIHRRVGLWAFLSSGTVYATPFFPNYVMLQEILHFRIRKGLLGLVMSRYPGLSFSLLEILPNNKEVQIRVGRYLVNRLNSLGAVCKMTSTLMTFMSGTGAQ